MLPHGFLRVAAAAPLLRVADCAFNAEHILSVMRQAESENVAVLVFPELALTGYTCADLFHQSALQRAALAGLARLLAEGPRHFGGLCVVGLPVAVDDQVFNCAAVLHRGQGHPEEAHRDPAMLDGVVHGRGRVLADHLHAGQQLLAGVGHVLKVRVIAPLERRAKVAMEQRQIGYEAALKHLQRVDEERDRPVVVDAIVERQPVPARDLARAGRAASIIRPPAPRGYELVHSPQRNFCATKKPPHHPNGRVGASRVPLHPLDSGWE